MDKMQVAERMMELVDELSTAEANVISAGFVLDDAKTALADLEAELLICADSPINGKNAEIRAAQMRQETATERQAIQVAETALLREKNTLNKLQNEFKALRAIVGILSNQINGEVA